MMVHELTYSWADQDQRAVALALAEDRRVIVEAPPGTGKTFTTIYLALTACRNGLSSRHRPSIILTFSNNARAQLEDERNRFIIKGRMTRAEAATIRIENYHAFYLEILRQRRGAWGCSTKITPATEHERDERITSALGNDATEEDRKTAGERSLLLPSSSLSEEQHRHLRGEAARAVRAGRPHYDDFAPLVRHLLECSPYLVQWLQTFPVVLLDEFQDTDQEQFAILKLWNPERLAIFYDRYQMIYAFRGADPNRPDNVGAFFGIKRTLTLSTLHRVEQHDSLGHFIMSLRCDDLVGEHATTDARPWLRIIRSNTKKTMRYEQRSAYELRYNAKIVHDESTAILTRKNDLAVKLQATLLAPPATHNAPYYSCALVGGPRGADERLRDAIYDLRRITTPEQLRLWTGALLDDVNVKPYQQTKKPVFFATEFAKPLARVLNGASGIFASVREEFREWHADPRHPVSIYEALGLVLRWAKLLAVGRYADPDRRFYITRMHTASSGASTWDDACDALEAALLTGKHFRRMSQHGVTICTVHQSNGREFNHVIIPWIGWPETYDHGSFDDRRLFYVALTRARQRVTIIVPAETQTPILTAWKLGTPTHKS